MSAFGDMFNDFPLNDYPDNFLPVDYTGSGFVNGFESGLIDPNQLIYTINPVAP